MRRTAITISWRRCSRATPAGEEPVAWLIADHAAQRRWGLGWAKPFPFPLAAIPAVGLSEARADARPSWRVACGLEPAALEATVARFNDERAARRGSGIRARARRPTTGCRATRRRRGPNPALGAAGEGAVLRGPHRARGASAPSPGCGPTARRGCSDATGAAIPGLFAVGNDMSSIMGGNYPERRHHPRAGDDLRIRRRPGAGGAARGRASTRRQRGCEELTA